MTIVIFAICLAGPAYGLWQSGMPQAFLAGPGKAAHDVAAGGATAAGYAQGIPAKGAWVTGGEHEQLVELRGDLCYAFTVASGVPVTGIRLLDPAGGELATSGDLSFSHQIIHCPSTPGVHRLMVSLDKGHGRYTWSWSWKEPEVSKPSTKSGSGSSSSSSKKGVSGGESGSSRSSGSAKAGTRTRRSGR